MKRNQIIKTIKIFTVLALLSSMIFSYGLVKAADPTIVSVTAPERVNQGQTFVVNIDVTPGDPIAGMQFDLSFDGSLVTAVEVAEGDLLSQGGANSYFTSGTIETGSVSSVYGVIITPGETVSEAGTFATITFTANDTSGECALTLSNLVLGDMNGQSLPVEVVNGQIDINSAPVFVPIGDKTTDEGTLLQFTVNATDVDWDYLVYSVANLPEGAAFDPETRTFSWTPSYAQAGTYPEIIFQVTDGYSTDQEIITVTVNQPYSDWDVNADNNTNVLDMIRIGQHWGETGDVGWIPEDVNEDGIINVLDIILVGQNWTG